MINVQVIVDSKDVQRTLRRIGDNLPSATTKMVKGMADRTRNRFKQVLKKHSTSGNLLRSIRTVRLGPKSYGVVGAMYLNVIETGSTPHLIPMDARNILWARKHGMKFSWLKRAIAKKGNTAYPFMEATMSKLYKEYESDLRKKFGTFIKSKGRYT